MMSSLGFVLVFLVSTTICGFFAIRNAVARHGPTPFSGTNSATSMHRHCKLKCHVGSVHFRLTRFTLLQTNWLKQVPIIITITTFWQKFTLTPMRQIVQVAFSSSQYSISEYSIRIGKRSIDSRSFSKSKWWFIWSKSKCSTANQASTI